MALPIVERGPSLPENRGPNSLNIAGYQKAAERLIAEQVNATEPAIDLIGNSYLSEDLKGRYIEIVRANTGVLSG